ncbi:hypothetical protein SAMN05421736_101726 [Evansella caseinilytica]|uniref:Uncharacterized protein n=1 Tax=Evansella caseinilytica TaxID=1503961 RepID=A0A1H3I5Y0_9BACI|nr:hypothetical protein SAMN05421736_101726 [Evansella caseinilytica]
MVTVATFPLNQKSCFRCRTKLENYGEQHHGIFAVYKAPQAAERNC